MCIRDRTDDDNSYSANSEHTKQAKLAIKFSFYNFNNEWVSPQTVRANPSDPSDPESLPMAFTFAIFTIRMAFSAAAANLVVFEAKNKLLDENPANEDPKEVISLRLRFLLWEWTGRISAGLDLENPDRIWRLADFSLTDPVAKLPSQTGIKPADVKAIIPWGSDEKDELTPWISFDAKGGSFLCRPTQIEPRDPEDRDKIKHRS